jgi:hypothetical protein
MGKNSVAAAMDKAGHNARLRDIRDQANVEEKKKRLLDEIYDLTGEEYGIHKKRKPNSKVAFSQIIQDNVFALVENNYLTIAEEAFLFRITSFVEYKSNCLVERERRKQKKVEVAEEFDEDGFLLEENATPSYFANYIGKSRQQISLIMNSLKKKGILATAESGMVTESGRICSTRTWLVNPHIIICGSKDEINPLLMRIFKDQLKNIKNKEGKKIILPVRLF